VRLEKSVSDKTDADKHGCQHGLVDDRQPELLLEC
jgi:hypothetical protein